MAKYFPFAPKNRKYIHFGHQTDSTNNHSTRTQILKTTICDMLTNRFINEKICMSWTPTGFLSITPRCIYNICDQFACLGKQIQENYPVVKWRDKHLLDFYPLLCCNVVLFRKTSQCERLHSPLYTIQSVVFVII